MEPQPPHDSAAGGRGVVAIPARLASTRLPNKLLLTGTGRPLLAHVIERAKEAVTLSRGLLTGVIVACDDERLLRIAEAACLPHRGGLPAGRHGRQASGGAVRGVMTGAHHRCGTTRIAEAITKLGLEHSVDFVVNVQGDEPEIDPRAILTVVEKLLADPSAAMATLVVAMPPGTEAQKANPNAVKAIIDSHGRALYFSRCPVPFDRNPPEGGEPLWYLHLGIYAYRIGWLLEFAQLPPCRLEERESLEQLRALDAGKTIRVGIVPAEWAGKGIDTPDDYAAFVRRCAA
jgi:3-deoxy-manno-octulosonate cytidylyltransferase (CMP-KDO synthetase)